MCQTEAIGRDLPLMKRLSEETGSLPLCRCRISPVLMSLQTPGTTYHPLTASLHLILLLHNLLLFFFIIFVIICTFILILFILVSLSLLFVKVNLVCHQFKIWTIDKKVSGESFILTFLHDILFFYEQITLFHSSKYIFSNYIFITLDIILDFFFFIVAGICIIILLHKKMISDIYLFIIIYIHNLIHCLEFRETACFFSEVTWFWTSH